MKIKLLFTAVCGSTMLFAQNTFDYTRSWGTYLGPLRGEFSGFYSSSNVVVGQNGNVHVNGYIIPLDGLSTTYYRRLQQGYPTEIIL